MGFSLSLGERDEKLRLVTLQGFISILGEVGILRVVLLGAKACDLRMQQRCRSTTAVRSATSFEEKRDVVIGLLTVCVCPCLQLPHYPGKALAPRNKDVDAATWGFRRGL